MEEVDNIIIDALRNLSCNIDENVKSLKEFTTEMVFSSMSHCLETILPDISLPGSLPQSMSLRLKHATAIAEHIKGLGYRGDMGYQTILYCNEIEVRRVLMFLVERLPRETHKTVTDELGYVPRLVKKIEETIRLNLEKPWVPCDLLRQGVRDCGSVDLKLDFGHSPRLLSERIQVPNLQDEAVTEALKHYWIHHLPDVSRQCAPHNLIPSLLYNDSKFVGTVDFIKSPENKETSLNVVDGVEEVPNAIVAPLVVNEVVGHGEEDHFRDLHNELEDYKRKHEGLVKVYNDLEQESNKTKEMRNKKEQVLKESVAKIKTRSKTMAVLKNDDNLIKLKSLVENGNKRLVELANHWNDIQTPLLKEYEQLQQQMNTQKAKLLGEEQKLQNVKTKKAELLKELADKEKLERQLLQECETLHKNTNRSAYTRRILEIIGNIKKQNDDIDKILYDTKIVQKDINNLNGQLDRSFTLSDELIFRDAKRDEMSRKAYKLLATLHGDCGEVVQAVTNLGLVERECRNLQEQIDAELLRETGSKLERLNADIAAIKKENAELENKEH
ncbi:hypothetical protein PPYR_07528 [Photinus pyralis]|uniref:Coiled-coil domain-containing protein 22 homolog n=1 Tax=Photinus pyralis TaxID=7054 RepID=A0A1Y1MJ25_PHOPY|nr:coiled-coil domain-containing protein 22 homolog [Photinus pyralis]KAB0799648.1 hypothetical protein PPYR_07528 [Photinus pyralis]